MLTRIDWRDVLLISTVDRRGGGADCTVHAWAGTLTQDSFVPDTDWPPAGQRIDLGPDFYAAMTGSDGRIVAWLSSWATARAMPWPGFAGGPISLARRLSLAGNRVRHRVAEGISAAFARPVTSVPIAGLATATINGAVAFSLRLASATGFATIAGDPRCGSVAVSRVAEPPLAWAAHHDGVLTQCNVRRLSLFVDGPVAELFIEPDGVAVSLALPTMGRPWR